jgi:hypothetical protein
MAVLGSVFQEEKQGAPHQLNPLNATKTAGLKKESKEDA